MNRINLADVIVGVANRFRQQNAIVSDRLTLTYEELIIRAAKSSRELLANGLESGQNVGIAMRDNSEALVLLIAVWMLDCVAVPIDFRTKPYDRVELAREFNLAAILEDRQAHSDAAYTSILVEANWTDIIAGHDSAPMFLNHQAPALIQLSSGTTGRPMGFVTDHERLFIRQMLPLELAPRNTGGVALTSLPMSFSAARNIVLNGLLNGSSVHFLSPLSGPEEIGEAIVSRRATAISVVPTILHGMLQIFGGRTQPVFDSLDIFICGSAPLAAEEKQLARKSLSRNFLETYSTTMTGRISFLHGEDIDQRPETVGRVLPQVALEIVDKSDNPLRIGEIGEIRVRSPCMARAIIAGGSRSHGDRLNDGWAYPGDLGSVDEQGFLQLHGRGADLIIRRGVNVFPAEVERAISKADGVLEVAVVGYRAAREGEEIAAFVVTDGTVDASALEAHCRVRLTPEKRPRRFLFTTALPRNANGKILRTQLREELGIDNAGVGPKSN